MIRDFQHASNNSLSLPDTPKPKQSSIAVLQEWSKTKPTMGMSILSGQNTDSLTKPPLGNFGVTSAEVAITCPDSIPMFGFVFFPSESVLKACNVNILIPHMQQKYIELNLTQCEVSNYLWNRTLCHLCPFTLIQDLETVIDVYTTNISPPEK